MANLRLFFYIYKFFEQKAVFDYMDKGTNATIRIYPLSITVDCGMA